MRIFVFLLLSFLDQILLMIFDDMSSLYAKLNSNKSVVASMRIVLARAEFLTASHAQDRGFESKWYFEFFLISILTSLFVAQKSLRLKNFDFFTRILSSQLLLRTLNRSSTLVTSSSN
jgi:hypothetical protein